MTKALRLEIDEPTPGQFFWTLTRQREHGEQPLIVDFSMEPTTSRAAAVEAGHAAMQRNQIGFSEQGSYN